MQDLSLALMGVIVSDTNCFKVSSTTTAYSGSEGEIFGREWLSGFGDTVSTQAQVDEALADLVDG